MEMKTIGDVAILKEITSGNIFEAGIDGSGCEIISNRQVVRGGVVDYQADACRK